MLDIVVIIVKYDDFVLAIQDLKCELDAREDFLTIGPFDIVRGVREEHAVGIEVPTRGFHLRVSVLRARQPKYFQCEATRVSCLQERALIAILFLWVICHAASTAKIRLAGHPAGCFSFAVETVNGIRRILEVAEEGYYFPRSSSS